MVHANLPQPTLYQYSLVSLLFLHPRLQCVEVIILYFFAEGTKKSKKKKKKSIGLAHYATANHSIGFPLPCCQLCSDVVALGESYWRASLAFSLKYFAFSRRYVCCRNYCQFLALGSVLFLYLYCEYNLGG